MKLSLGKGAVVSALILGSFAGNANAMESYCAYGGSPQGAVLFKFTRVETGLPRFPRHSYEARLSPRLVVRVTMTQGHSAHFRMIANYNAGLVTMEDSYVDFAPPRKMYLAGSVEGERLSCNFDPKEF